VRRRARHEGASASALGWLAAGALAGLVVAAGSLVVGGSRDDDKLPDGAVAVINGEPLRTADYERALLALANDRRNPVGDVERRFVLERLVDEELLVQRALELGLAQNDRTVRSQLVAVMLASVTEAAALREPEDDELRAFHAEHAEWFQEPTRLHVRQLWVRGEPARRIDDMRQRAATAAARLRAGEPFDVVAAALGDVAVAQVPDAPLPPAKLVEYAGPDALAALASAAIGTITDPLPFAGGLQVLELVDQAPSRLRGFDDVAGEVRAEYRRRAGERALRRYLAELRERAEIRVTEVTP
jgi:parvulin-like peptidyl-prolyl isomerase